MFGSVSDLILKAKNPPYKVSTQAGALVFNSLTGAVLAIIKSQREQPNVDNLRRVNPVGGAISPEPDDCDFTFDSDEQRSGRSRERVTRRRTAPDESALDLNSLMNGTDRPSARGWSAGDMIVDELSGGLGESLLRQPIPAMPSGMRSNEAQERALANDVQAMHDILNQMRERQIEGRAYDSGEQITAFATIMRRIWNRMHKSQVGAMCIKIRGIVGENARRTILSGSYVNILRKWLYTAIIHHIVSTDRGRTTMTGMMQSFIDEKDYWQGRLHINNYATTEQRQAAQHNIADTINHITYNIDQLNQMITVQSLQAIREYAGVLVTNGRIRHIEDDLFKWIHGHSSIEVGVRGLCTLVLVHRLPERVFEVNGTIDLNYRTLPINRGVAIPLSLLIKQRHSISNKIRMTMTCGLGIDTLGFELNKIGRHTGQYLHRAAREMIVYGEQQNQDRTLDILYQDMSRSIQHHNDCNITRFHNPQ